MRERSRQWSATAFDAIRNNQTDTGSPRHSKRAIVASACSNTCDVMSSAEARFSVRRLTKA